MNRLTTAPAREASSPPAPSVAPNLSFLPGALIALGALLRIASFFFSDNAGGDAWTRVAMTAKWLEHPVFEVALAEYGPGHFWLIAFFTLIFHHIVFAARFLSLVTGIASLVLIWRLARNLYGEPAGVFALAVFVLYSLHIGYSTTSSAEVTYLFFLLAGLMLFFGYFRDVSRSLGRLAIGGLCLSVAETIRLEAWVVFFALEIILMLLLLEEERPLLRSWAQWLKPVLTLALTAGAWPIFSMAYTLVVFHDPLRVLSMHNAEVTGFFKAHPVSLVYQLALIPGALLISLSPLACLAALYGVLESVTSRLAAAFAALTLFFAAVQSYEIATGKLLAMARYSLTLGAMLAVIAGFGLARWCARWRGQDWRLGFSLVFAFLLANLAVVFYLSEHPNRFQRKLQSVSARLRYPEYLAEVGHYLGANMAREDAVLIDNYNDESNIVAQVAGLPLDPGTRAFLANTANHETAEDYLIRKRPRFVVYSDQGTLRRSFPLPSSCGTAAIAGSDYQCVLSNSIYRVYRRGENGLQTGQN